MGAELHQRGTLQIQSGSGTNRPAHVQVRSTSIAAIRCRSEEHTSELQSHSDLVCRLLLEKKKKNDKQILMNGRDWRSMATSSRAFGLVQCYVLIECDSTNDVIISHRVVDDGEASSHQWSI